MDDEEATRVAPATTAAAAPASGQDQTPAKKVIKRRRFKRSVNKISIASKCKRNKLPGVGKFTKLLA